MVCAPLGRATRQQATIENWMLVESDDDDLDVDDNENYHDGNKGWGCSDI